MRGEGLGLVGLGLGWVGSDCKRKAGTDGCLLDSEVGLAWGWGWVGPRLGRLGGRVR